MSPVMSQAEAGIMVVGLDAFESVLAACHIQIGAVL